MINTGEHVVCVDVAGGGGVRRHLADMGVLPGVHMTVVSGGNAPGPVVVSLRGGKIMLGRGMSHRILVRPVS